MNCVDLKSSSVEVQTRPCSGSDSSAGQPLEQSLLCSVHRGRHTYHLLAVFDTNMNSPATSLVQWTQRLWGCWLWGISVPASHECQRSLHRSAGWPVPPELQEEVQVCKRKVVWFWCKVIDVGCGALTPLRCPAHIFWIGYILWTITSDWSRRRSTETGLKLIFILFSWFTSNLCS